MRLLILIILFIVIGSNQLICQNAIHKNDKNSSSNKWIGRWERDKWQFNAGLEITQGKNDTVFYSLSSYIRGVSDGLSGPALIIDSNKSIAKWTFLDDKLEFIFELIGDSVITLTQKQGNSQYHKNVNYSGIYKRSSLIKIHSSDTMNLVDLGVLKDIKDDFLFRNFLMIEYGITDYYYYLFLNSTDKVSEVEDIDGFNCNIISSKVCGMEAKFENIIIIDSSKHIWAAVIDDRKLLYFTNANRFKDELPKTIEKWREGFKDYEVIFVKK